jgi:excisionase family DNA binding protein
VLKSVSTEKGDAVIAKTEDLSELVRQLRDDVPGPPLVVKEVAAILRLSSATTYELVRSGHLAAVRLPGCGKVLVERQSLRSYLDAGRTGAATA